eukprot:TRINITY_DN5435_c0_g1_i12.p1 TRINITY_DN5435_c0_g1~~TRINITY_DN5435_c0_g1_i12.p1  ORF type:complete len:368 (+),score=64.35 TRINITY_DN5435_c0_g1_i12:1078-2181(+)
MGLVSKLSRPRRRRSFASTSAVLAENVTSNVSTQIKSKPIQDVLAGAFARAASQSTIHPIDTLKVRLQHSSNNGQKLKGIKVSFNSPMRGLASLGKGVASLYKGVGGAASGAGIAIGAYFAFYSVACNVISKHTALPPGGVAFLGGAVAAAGSSVVKVPLAVCIRSVQAGVYKNVFHAASSITKAAGPKGLFTGYFPTLIEDVPDMACKFAAYESLRSVYKLMIRGRQASVHEDFAIGAIAGAFAAAVTTPFDVIKTNMMCSAASRPTMIATAKTVFKRGGARAFFEGVTPRAVSNGINSAVFFCFFEAIRAFLKEQNKKAKQQQQLQSAVFVPKVENIQVQEDFGGKKGSIVGMSGEDQNNVYQLA